MKTIDKTKLVEIVSSLMLEPSDEVINQILVEWDTIQKQLSFLNKIDTNGVKPLTHINETPIVDFFREDEVDYTGAITKETALKNAYDSDDDYIITSKVVQ
ncbi:aspartyl/glutamyl-tRNA amidotransferase subunit C [Mycoplasma sp. ES3157-GEN-MYC]|uniref:Aspartyl/glutamyl-tRNA amidotransferase subunit C n=1 Tax=Mycoplasma miroungigenitalium TaxID=754515 RepID=A0A6M4J8Z6_9MOLU|nr:Asp-tRNA(Asn)/Glu-tRNA(Gln) amidotransferase subunit GatC [Mycoplasma miroungigenitalium]MBU4690372.1 aspartyl/glutamyl-tRNA amidotransferase subunit C [Mycoplasma miroungigenitalium]MBU4691639.1 aspartyl/glutamyl-tRNA amidotransferase subunit C [Mycoplasma miroungigenitalium]QJR43464.1 aspartyl/glutamyl-tRNA amidotransferase subunit C [Mycoplasma miroungigenitalium]